MRTPLFSRGSSPFALTPDPRFAFPSSSYQAALEMLQRGLDQRVGPMLLIGPAGCGKTMLLRALQDRIARDGGIAFFRRFFPFNPSFRFDPDAAVDDLLSSLLAELQHESIPPSRAEREQALGQYIEQLPLGAHAVVLLDDAHRFDESDRDLILMPQRLDALRLILAGRPDLVERYRQLIPAHHVGTEVARNPAVVEVGPLTPGEIAPYVAHRLASARMNRSLETSSPEPFETAALERVFAYSKGVPRTVNRLCASALSGDPRVVDAAAIDAAALECGLMLPLFPHGAAAAVHRRPVQLPHDRVESRRASASSTTARRHLLYIASALAAALGVVAGVFYFGDAYLGLDGAVTTAPTRRERPAPPDIIASTEIAPSAGMIDPATEPESGSVSKPEARRELPSSDESDRSGAPAMSASEHDGALLAMDHAPDLAAPLPNGTEPSGTDSDGRADSAAPAVMDTTDADELIGSEPQLGTETLVDGMLDASQPGEDLLSSTQEISSASGHGAEQPQARNDNAVVQPAAPVSPDRTASGAGNAPAERAPEATRSDRPPADLARSGVLEPQAARAPAAPSAQSSALNAELLVARGYSLFDMGDPASARLFFERAAMQGHAGAMLGAGETFDPIELQRRRIFGVRGEPDRALDWYRRSAEAGDRVAGERLARLNDWISRRGNQR